MFLQDPSIYAPFQVDVYIYDYGKLDVVVRLGFTSALPALLYDPGCTMCPIGIGASGLCVSRFTLYPSSGAEPSFNGLPLTVILWELLLGPRNLSEAVEFLKGLYVESPPMAGAAMLLMQPGHGAAMVEWSPKQICVSPAAEGVLVHANHCILDSWMNKVTLFHLFVLLLFSLSLGDLPFGESFQPTNRYHKLEEYVGHIIYNILEPLFYFFGPLQLRH